MSCAVTYSVLGTHGHALCRALHIVGPQCLLTELKDTKQHFWEVVDDTCPHLIPTLFLHGRCCDLTLQ